MKMMHIKRYILNCKETITHTGISAVGKVFTVNVLKIKD